MPALYIGCMLSNMASPYFIFDVFLGSLATLLAALASYLVGRFLKKEPFRMILSGFFPVRFNALIIPFISVFLCGGDAGYESAGVAYLAYMGSLALTEAVWVYALGTPLYYSVKRLQKQSSVGFLS